MNREFCVQCIHNFMEYFLEKKNNKQTHEEQVHRICHSLLFLNVHVKCAHCELWGIIQHKLHLVIRISHLTKAHPSVVCLCIFFLRKSKRILFVCAAHPYERIKSYRLTKTPTTTSSQCNKFAYISSFT